MNKKQSKLFSQLSEKLRKELLECYGYSEDCQYGMASKFDPKHLYFSVIYVDDIQILGSHIDKESIKKMLLTKEDYSFDLFDREGKPIKLRR